jgi:hypothetical protein
MRSRRSNFTTQETAALVEIEAHFRTAAAVQPAAGFSRRWLTRLKAQQARDERVRAGWLLVGNLAAALLVLAVLLSQLGQPTSWIIRGVDQINIWLATAEATLNAAVSLAETFPILIFYPAVALILMMIFWGVLVKRSFAVQGEFNE